jgi:hypothetical protein
MVVFVVIIGLPAWIEAYNDIKERIRLHEIMNSKPDNEH